MPVTKAQVRSGAYYDSVVLMQLQRSLAGLPGVLDAGVVMGTGANKDILAQTGLLAPEAQAASADDLVIVVQAQDEPTAESALGKVDELGWLLHKAWESKKIFSSKVTAPYIDELYGVARQNGAIGGKLLGAGGGGYLLLLCEFDKWHIVARRLEELGGKVVHFAFEFNGLQTWEVYTSRSNHE